MNLKPNRPPEGIIFRFASGALIDMSKVTEVTKEIGKYLKSTEQYIFVDESGDTNLSDVPGENHDYYVITGVIIPASDLTSATTCAQEIVERHAGDGELKSSNIGGRSSRRQQILEEMAVAKFQYYCLVVDKNRIWRDSGLRWKPSFYKFLHRMFYSRIKGAFLEMTIIADDYGRSEFKQSFRKYILELGSLFETFEFKDSRSSPFLQLADVVAGTVRRAYSENDPPEILAKLGCQYPIIEEWPPKEAWGRETPENSQYDEAIRGISLRNIREYVESNLASDEEDAQLRAHAFRYLLARFDLEPEQYVKRAEIVSHIADVLCVNLSEQMLTTKIFADARDNGVILSSTDAGIKIPYNAKDLSDWMQRVESQVAPYLRRVEDARRTILLASNQKYDIAAAAHFPALCKYLKDG